MKNWECPPKAGQTKAYTRACFCRGARGTNDGRTLRPLPWSRRAPALRLRREIRGTRPGYNGCYKGRWQTSPSVMARCRESSLFQETRRFPAMSESPITDGEPNPIGAEASPLRRQFRHGSHP